MTKKGDVVVIKWADYQIQCNDPDELREARKKGPLVPDGSMQRASRTGVIIDGVEYELSGFGKLDKREPTVLPPDVDRWVRNYLGKAAMFNYTEELKLAIARRLSEWPKLRVELARMRKDNIGPLKSMQHVFLNEGKKPLEPAKEILPQQTKTIEVEGVEAYELD